MEKSVGIMLYFDNFHRVEGLPDDQLGLLFRALMACGEAELGGRDGITGFEARYPAMGERAQMAFAFMADNIRRDAAAYHAKRDNLRYAAQYGDRILMMRQGQVVLDRAGADKAATSMDDLLAQFNRISLETGN